MKKITKSLLSLSTISSILIAPVAVISCGNNVKKTTNVFFGQKNLSIKRFKMNEKIAKKDLSQIGNVNNFYKTDLMIGGYGEPRMFYSGKIDSNSSMVNYHMGDDLLIEQDTPVYAPYGGEIISAWWYNKTMVTIADGIGGVILVKTPIANFPWNETLKEYVYVKKLKKTGSEVKTSFVAKVPKIMFIKNSKFNSSEIKDYKINDPIQYQLFNASQEEYNNYLKTTSQEDLAIFEEANKYIYTFYIHLGKKSIEAHGRKTDEYKDTKRDSNVAVANVDSSNPIKLKKNGLVGYVGSGIENGGWTPHLHVETYVFLPETRYSSIIYRSIKKYKTNNLNDPEKINIWNSKAVGTFGVSAKQTTDWDKYEMSFADFQRNKRFAIAPNNIYNYYNQDTPIVNIEI